MPVFVTALLEKIAASVTEAGVAAFLKSKFTLSVGGILGVLCIYLVGHHRGYAEAAAKCNEAAERARVEAVTRDLDIQKRVAADAETARKTLAGRYAVLQKKAQKYEDSLKSQPACILNGVDVRRLRGIQ
jgi:hypothetical protein